MDEAHIGGKESNKHERKEQKAGRSTVGKTAVAGAKDRPTNQIHTEGVGSTGKATLQNFVIRHTEKEATVYSDEAAAYVGIPRSHQAVKPFNRRVCTGYNSPPQWAGEPLGVVQTGIE